MNRKELYEKSVNKLLDAYNNQTLRFKDCSACAVGNLLGSSAWGSLFSTGPTAGIGQVTNSMRKYLTGKWSVFIRYGYLDLSNLIMKRQSGRNSIKKSGYTRKELMEIEYAFEATQFGSFKTDQTKEAQLKGLTAVLKELARIHGVDVPEAEVNQKRLEKVYESSKCELVTA